MFLTHFLFPEITPYNFSVIFCPTPYAIIFFKSKTVKTNRTKLLIIPCSLRDFTPEQLLRSNEKIDF